MNRKEKMIELFNQIKSPKTQDRLLDIAEISLTAQAALLKDIESGKVTVPLQPTVRSSE